MVCLIAKIYKTPNQGNPAILPIMVKTFDPGVFHVPQQDAAVALFDCFRVAFEDVEEFLDDGLVVVPNDDNAVHNVPADRNALIGRIALGLRRV
jgi:hypothetical protein